MRYLVVILLIIPFCVFAEIYKWTDEKGNVHFGDRPKGDYTAEEISVEVNSYEHVTSDNVQPSQASKSKQVTMYATSWCGYCSKARNYFREKGIAYTEYDIEKNESAKRKYDLLGGKGVPVILVGDKRMNGFSIGGFEGIYE